MIKGAPLNSTLSALLKKMLDWLGDDEQQCAVIPDGDAYAIFTAARDGTLTIFGDKWKECPGISRCKRPGRVRPPERCEYCSWSGKANLKDQAQAMRVAEKIASDYCETADN